MSIPGNLPGQHRPHPARHLFSIAGISIFTVLIIGSFFMAAVYLRTLIETNQLAAVITSTLVDLANDDRKQDNLGTLTINPKLVAAAQAKANDMAAKGYFAHNSPDGQTSWTWFQQAGYSFSYAGENLAVNFADSEDVEEAWMDSPTHRANILNGKFTEIGIATAQGEYKGKKTTFVVQMFGRPKQTTAFAPVNESTQPENPEEIAIATTETGGTVVLGTAIPAPAAATSAPVAAVEEVPAQKAPTYSSMFGFLVSSPQNLLRTIYVFSALIVILALGLTTRMEFKRHHFRHMVAAVFLLALMGGLFTAADHLVFKPPVIGMTQVSVVG
ncbi:MAG TPA: CAP domain-containing protein [Candidatus Paceibacterota bacterium]|nr:CAP domain-containing protein [Candidatus Paceibacterota bacterium]